MRKVVVIGGSSCHGLVNRLAAEIAARAMHDVQVVSVEDANGLATHLAADKASQDPSNVEYLLVEGTLTQHAVEESLKALDADSETTDSKGTIPGDAVIIGFGSCFGLSRELVLEPFEVYAPTIEFEKPRQEHSQYWQQGNHKFDRKQQSMRAKARR